MKIKGNVEATINFFVEEMDITIEASDFHELADKLDQLGVEHSDITSLVLVACIEEN